MITTSFVVLAGAASAFAFPAPAPAPAPAPVPQNLTRRGDVACGTTQDADLAACQSILDNWSGNLDDTHECHYGGFFDGSNTAWNVASVPGCSVYVTAKGKEQAAVREAVEKLMGCRDEGVGKVNGLTLLADKTGVCIGGNDGCGDCFDDQDFDNLVKYGTAKRRALDARAVDPGKIGNIAGAIAAIINGAAGSDITKRENGVKNMVDGMQKEVPNTNVVVCHTDHEARFDGAEGVDWTHTHFEIDISLGGTIGYEVYVGGSGTFKRNGDGGWINWGWAGVLAKDAEEDGSLLTFASR